MRSRPGVTLVELMVALAVFAALLATTLGFYRAQGTAFTRGNERMTLMQNLRYGVNTLEQNLRTAGVGVPAEQPVLVYAGEEVVAFNADYATADPSDAFAVYRDTRLPAGARTSVPPSERFVIPRTGVSYPDSAYYVGSTASPAETITFFFAPDSTTPRTDDHVLYRQVNRLAPDVVARRLLRSERPFLTYYVTRRDGAEGPVAAVPPSRLPATHAVPIHGSPGDTGWVAGVDSIRAVEVAYTVTNGLEGEREQRREIRRLIRLPNAGLETRRVCGNIPLLGTALVAVGQAPDASTPGHIHLQWGAATDEKSGEGDVLRYVVWRRESGSAPWGDPLVSLSPGSTLYEYDDFTARPGVAYAYALAAQDCTPQYSKLSVTGPVSW